nr:reverse transcriptase domain-containing protein [Tanacetum cinerariifolium]
MSSASYAVTYTSVYTDSEPGKVFWEADEELSDGGSLRVIVYGYDGLPMLPVAPPSPDYEPGPEEPHTPPPPQDEDEHEPMFIQPHDLDFVPEPIYPELLSRIQKKIQRSMRMMRQRMVRLTILWTEEMMEMMMTPVIPPPSTDTATTRARITVRLQATISFPPEAERVDLLMKDKIAHQETIQIMEDEAYAAREAWAHSIGLSQAVHSELQTHQEQMQETEIAKLQETDRRRQAQMVETLRVMEDMRREMGDMQAELLALHEQPKRARQAEGDARVPNHQDAPMDADRTEGVVCLIRWIEKMESVFQISGCAIKNQVKFATYTLLDAALTWWNSQIRSLGPDAYSMTWEMLKKKMTGKYCPQGEIKKLEIELWNLKVKENNVPVYTKRFQELTLICTKFVADETEKIN